MKRCDICQTIIPLGNDVCPNCGFAVKKDKETREEYRQPEHTYVPKSKKKKKRGFPKWILVFPLVFFIVFIIIIGLQIYTTFTIFDKTKDVFEGEIEEIPENSIEGIPDHFFENMPDDFYEGMPEEFNDIFKQFEGIFGDDFDSFFEDFYDQVEPENNFEHLPIN